MQRSKVRKMNEEFLKDQEKKRKEESEQINLKEEVSKPIRKFVSKYLKRILDSPYKNFFLIPVGFLLCSFIVLNGIVFYNDSIEAIRPDDNKQFQESVMEMQDYILTENKVLKEKVEKEKIISEDYKAKYETEKKAKEEIRKQFESLQKEMKNAK